MMLENGVPGVIYLIPRKGPKHKDKAPHGIYLVGSLMERIGIDILGPLPKTNNGNKYLLVCTDYFTKWPECSKSRGEDSCKTISRGIHNVDLVYFCNYILTRDVTSVPIYLLRCVIC